MLEEATPSPESIRAMVRDLCAEVLDVGAAEPSFSFIGLGGDSIAAMKLAGRIAERLGVELGVEQVFDAPDLEALGDEVVTLVRSGR